MRPMSENACRHYNGYFQNDTCNAGVKFRDVIPKFDQPGTAYRLPCKMPTDPHGLKVLQETGPRGVCGKFEPRTAEDDAADRAELKQLMDRVHLTIPWGEKLKAAYPKVGSGADICPVCKGVIRFSIAGRNLHLSAQCETEGCLAFME
jgi:hypothetical protein